MIIHGKFALQVLPDGRFELSDVETNRLLVKGQAALFTQQADGSLQDLLTGGMGALALVAGPRPGDSPFGPAQQWLYQGDFVTQAQGRLRQALVIETNPRYPQAFFLQWRFTNIGQTALRFDRLEAPGLQLGDWAVGDQASPALWSMQGAAVAWGQDFAFPLLAGFARENYLGHLQAAEGGGIPIVDFWNKTAGLALMHCEPAPKDCYMPVSAGPGTVTSALQQRQAQILQPGETIQSLKTALYLHHGDFFEPLAFYHELLGQQGLKTPQPIPADFEPGWCSWGYEFDVLPAEMTGVLPVLKELGIRWLTLDDRWFDAYGDWNPRKDTFPNGAADMRRMNAEIHAAGGFSQIWWYPLCAEDGLNKWGSHRYATSQLIQEHADWVILNADGSIARNNRHLAMLCPAIPEVRRQIADLTNRFIADWGFDGHKLDNIYTIPACYNPAHRHSRPEESTEAMAEAYRLIFEITRQLRPNSVTQICPCGTPISVQLLPFTDQTVTADPVSSAQIRQRIKFYKALCGARTAVFADHVELSDGGMDFASEIGAGGVPATKFIYPDAPHVRARLEEIWNLPAEKQAIYKKWFDLYNAHRPAEGEYLNLYDLAYDQPEAHAIRKGERLYYAFFAGRYRGKVELRGLEDRLYLVTDYANNRQLGVISGLSPQLEAAFEGSLLLYVEPA